MGTLDHPPIGMGVYDADALIMLELAKYNFDGKPATDEHRAYVYAMLEKRVGIQW